MLSTVVVGHHTCAERLRGMAKPAADGSADMVEKWARPMGSGRLRTCDGREILLQRRCARHGRVNDETPTQANASAP
jgi:hypothetical protein